jgi:hypothetical protein
MIVLLPVGAPGFVVEFQVGQRFCKRNVGVTPLAQYLSRRAATLRMPILRSTPITTLSGCYTTYEEK